MKVKKLALTTLVFVVTSLFYYACLSVFLAMMAKTSWFVVLPAVVLGVVFAWFFHRRTDAFPMMVFSVVVFFVSLIYFKMVLTYAFLRVVIFALPATFFVRVGVGIYTGINVFACILGVLLASQFYHHSKTCM